MILLTLYHPLQYTVHGFVCIHVCVQVFVWAEVTDDKSHMNITCNLERFWSITPHFYLFEMNMCAFFSQDESYTQVFLWVHIKIQYSASSFCQFNGRAGSSHSFSTPPPPYPTPLSYTYTGLQPRSYTLQSETPSLQHCYRNNRTQYVFVFFIIQIHVHMRVKN